MLSFPTDQPSDETVRRSITTYQLVPMSLKDALNDVASQRGLDRDEMVFQVLSSFCARELVALNRFEVTP